MKPRTMSKPILRHQRPKKRFQRKALLKTLATTTLLSVTFFLYWKFQSEIRKIFIFELNNQEQLTFNVATVAENLPQNDYDKIQAMLTNCKIAELPKIATEIQEQFSARRVSIVRTGESELLVEIESHKPVLAIDFDGLRLINEDGYIYGHPQIQKDQIFPLLTGLAMWTSRPQMQEDQTYRISDSNQSIIFDALLLLRESLRYNIKYDQIHFDPYRGFKATLSQKDVSIQIGLAPFAEKLKRLNIILRNLERKGKSAKSIELDYQNKAFIQES